MRQLRRDPDAQVLQRAPRGLCVHPYEVSSAQWRVGGCSGTAVEQGSKTTQVLV